MARNLEHPVWDVYDQLRNARLNCKYYSCRVATLKRQDFWMEVILAATASGSAIAGLAFWDTHIGKVSWQALTVVSALIAVPKPFLRLTEKIQCLEELVGDYRLVEYELKKIEVNIRQRKVYDGELQSRFDTILDKIAEISRKRGGEYAIRAKLRRRCQLEVQEELPEDRFFIPGDP